MWSSIKSGDWLTPERLRNYPLIVLALLALAIIGAVVLSNNRMGPNGLPLGSDFSQVWIAGKEVIAGAPEAPFYFDRHSAAQRREFPLADGVFGWHYPPFFLAPAAALAHLPYLQALALWQLSTFAVYLLVILAIMKNTGVRLSVTLLTAVAFPAVAINLGHGQNGFLTAALLGAGFHWLDRAPRAAGAAFALLAYKPQFGLSLPLALLVERRARTIVAAVLVLAVMGAASVMAFGPGSWRAFFDNLHFTQRVVIEQGLTGFEKIQSVFAAARHMGASVSTAWTCQAATTLFVLAALVFLSRSTADSRAKAAGAILASLLTTPYALDYDLMALAPVIAFLVSHGMETKFLPYEKTALAVAYAAPLFARPVAMVVPFPIGVIALLLLFASTMRHAFAPQSDAPEA